MGHNHKNTKGHTHSHNIQVTNINRAFVIGIILNSLFVIIEFASGIYYDSMALVSDAGHNMVDVISLILALMAFKMSKIQSTGSLTYGYRKTTILASLVNSVLLFITVGIIIKESIERFINPVHIDGRSVIIVATIGIFINALTAYLFLKDKDKDINIKGAYLHMAADALVSLGVVISGIVILYTDWYILDTIISVVIVLVIFFSTWQLFKDSINLVIDGVPKEVDVDKINKKIKSIEKIIDIHHLHIWGLSTTENALTAHIVIDDNVNLKELAYIKEKIKHKLQHLNIDHATLEFETKSEKCHDLHD